MIAANESSNDDKEDKTIKNNPKRDIQFNAFIDRVEKNNVFEDFLAMEEVAACYFFVLLFLLFYL